MIKKSYPQIAYELYESVEQSERKQKRLLSSTFWKKFRVKHHTHTVVERIERIMSEQNLTITVKSGAVFGKEKKDDWITLTIWPPEPPIPPGPEDNGKIAIPTPPDEWFDQMKTRLFESEKEVEYFFIMPLLEQLGYLEEDAAMGCAVRTSSGSRAKTRYADVVLFNGSSRENDNVLLLIEAKVNGKAITVDNIGQARYYARELLPACYVITNGEKVIVFQFNGMWWQDKRVMEFDRSELKQLWGDLYKYISKQATINRKEWMKNIPKNVPQQHQFSTS